MRRRIKAIYGLKHSPVGVCGPAVGAWDRCKCPDPSCLPRRSEAEDNTCTSQLVFPVAPHTSTTTKPCLNALHAFCPNAPEFWHTPGRGATPDQCWTCVNKFKDKLTAAGCTLPDLVSRCNYLSPADADSMAARQCEKYYSEPLISMHNHVCTMGKNNSGRKFVGGWYPKGETPDGKDAWYIYNCKNGTNCS